MAWTRRGWFGALGKAAAAAVLAPKVDVAAAAAAVVEPGVRHYRGTLSTEFYGFTVASTVAFPLPQGGWAPTLPERNRTPRRPQPMRDRRRTRSKTRSKTHG
jgi:hypothetical protein